VQRLSRMSPMEIAFRVREQALHFSDRRSTFSWEASEPFPGALSGLPSLDLDAATSLIHDASKTRDRLVAAQFHWLGQSWPAMGADWLHQLWTLDPVSKSHWPGTGAKAGYRRKDERGDVKFVWEPNRLQLLHSLALLAAHGDAAAEQLGWTIIESWMTANPPYQGVNWSSGIEAASRVVSVLVFLSGAKSIDATKSDRLRRFLAAHARILWRYPSLYSSSNNHRVAELSALLLLSICAPQLPLGRNTTSSLMAELELEITRQFHSDGVGAEQSPTYAAYDLEWFTLAAAAAGSSGVAISQTYRARVAAAAEHLTWLFDEAGHPPRIGDDDEGRVLALSMEPEPRYAASVATMSLRWLGKAQLPVALRDTSLRDYVRPVDSLRAISPPTGVRHFADGGYTIVRRPASHGHTVLTIDYGPLGFLSIAAHGHADALSLTLSWGDEPVIVDSGTFLYHAGGDRRDRMRGTGVHNTLAIEDTNQSRIVGPFAWADHAKSQLISRDENSLAAACFGWQKRFGVVHERRVDWQDGKISVEDHLIGTASDTLNWTSGLSLAPGCKVEVAGPEADIVTHGGRRFRLRSSAPWHLARSDYSAAFNHIEEVDRLELRGDYAAAPERARVAAFSIEFQN